MLEKIKYFFRVVYQVLLIDSKNRYEAINDFEHQKKTEKMENNL